MGITTTTYRIIVNTSYARGEWVAAAQIAMRGAGVAEGEAHGPDEHVAMIEAVRAALEDNARGAACAL